MAPIEEACALGCGSTRGNAALVWRVRIGTVGALAACEHAIWFEGSTSASAAHRTFWLRSAGLGLREYVRGHAVLHGSAVATAGSGIALVGEARVGKSSLAAWLCRNGWQFVSDAMAVVNPTTLLVPSQVPKVRLYDDSLQAIGVRAPEAIDFDDEVSGKRRWDIEACTIAPTGTSLRHIAVLETGPELTVEELVGSRAIMMLVRHSYLAAWLEPDKARELLSLAASLVSRGVRVHRIAYPREWGVFPDLAAVLERLQA